MLISPALYLELLHTARSSLQTLITDFIRADHDPLFEIEISPGISTMLQAIIVLHPEPSDSARAFITY
jgi:hypothetical protein